MPIFLYFTGFFEGVTPVTPFLRYYYICVCEREKIKYSHAPSRIVNKIGVTGVTGVTMAILLGFWLSVGVTFVLQECNYNIYL